MRNKLLLLMTRGEKVKGHDNLVAKLDKKSCGMCCAGLGTVR